MATEKRLIDANELREHKFTQPVQSFYSMGWNSAIDAIMENEPTVDAVEVVRCKDCRHYYPDTLSCRNLICCANWYPEDFCSYGERKDG